MFRRLLVPLMLARLGLLDSRLGRERSGGNRPGRSQRGDRSGADRAPAFDAGQRQRFIAARPFANVLELDKFLAAQQLTADQRAALYGKAFIHINLNSARRKRSADSSAGKRMARVRGIPAVLPSRSSTGDRPGRPKEVARFKQYTFIPLNLNTAIIDHHHPAPQADGARVRGIPAPKSSSSKRDREIRNAKEVARLWRYVVIQ